MSKKISSWSFSRYTTYKACPRSAYYKFIEKRFEPGSPAMDRGSDIHKKIEDYILGKTTQFPEEAKHVRAQVATARAAYVKDKNSVIVEDTWAFRRDWSITTWDDWNGCWLRVKVDCARFVNEHAMSITDWKTGKFRPGDIDDYNLQLKLYVLGAFLRYPQLERVAPRLVYVDEGMIFPKVPDIWTRDSVPILMNFWEDATTRMLADTYFEPEPGNACRWCYFRKSNGGPCQY